MNNDTISTIEDGSGITPLNPKPDAGTGGGGAFYIPGRPGQKKEKEEEKQEKKKNKKPVKLKLSETAKKYLERLEEDTNNENETKKQQ